MESCDYTFLLTSIAPVIIDTFEGVQLISTKHLPNNRISVTDGERIIEFSFKRLPVKKKDFIVSSRGGSLGTESSVDIVLESVFVKNPFSRIVTDRELPQINMVDSPILIQPCYGKIYHLLRLISEKGAKS